MILPYNMLVEINIVQERLDAEKIAKTFAIRGRK
jgi:hypothetical protein